MNYGKKETSQQRMKIQSKTAMKKSRNRFRFFKVFLLFCLLLILTGFIGAGLWFKKIIDDSPQITAEDIKPSAYTTTVYADDGTTILGTFVNAGANRVYTAYENIPQDLIDAFVAVEDSRFWDHNGIDYKGITRAAVTGIASGSFSQGGSTITQQLIKNSIFPNFSLESGSEKIERKIQELYLAVQIEKIVSKEEILENYLNTINLGQNTLGVQAAANRYFGKDVKDLTLSECATIAGITKSPTGYNPITNPDANAKRREKVLGDMLEQKYITETEYKEALKDNVYERIQTANTEYKESLTVNSYFLDEVAKDVMADLVSELGYSETQAYNAVYSGGLKIMTTQNMTMQQICDEELNRASNYPLKVEWTISGAISIIHPDGTANHYDHNSLGRYVKEKYGWENPTTFSTEDRANEILNEYIESIKTSPDDRVDTNLMLAPQPQATIVVIDQATGHVKAMVGGRGEKTADMSLNRATQSPRQPGSCFKVLSTFIPALDVSGNTLATLIEDAPFRYSDKDKTPVSNWWSGYKGNMTIRECIKESANVCTVKKYTEITPAVGYQYLTENFAFSTMDSKKDLGQAVSLGGITNGVYNIELTAAYASIANGGVYIEPILYTKIFDHDGNLLYENAPESHTAMKDTTAALITSAMQDVVKYGTGTATRLSNMPSAGKTGTTTKTRDLWFAGYTPYLTASVWSGYDDNQQISGSSSYHKVIWKKVMQRIVKECKQEYKNFEMPDSIVSRSICKATGKLASSDACEKYTEYFVKGTTPKQSCPGHIPAPTDPNAPATGTTPGATTTPTPGGTNTGNSTNNH